MGLATPDTDGVASPIKHGDRLKGAVETSRDEPTLKEAVTYLVRIQRISGEVCVVEFTP